MKELYFNKKEKRYFLVLTGEDLHCTFCNKVIELGSSFFIHKSYSKKEFNKNYYCLHCVKKHKTKVYDEFIVVEATNTLPNPAILVPDTPPSLQSGDLSVFDVATSNKGIQADCSGVEILDNTKLAGRDSISGASIGRDMREELEQRDSGTVNEILKRKPITQKRKRLLTKK